MVPGGGIEPPTRGFSIRCSTPELPGRAAVTGSRLRGNACIISAGALGIVIAPWAVYRIMVPLAAIFFTGRRPPLHAGGIANGACHFPAQSRLFFGIYRWSRATIFVTGGCGDPVMTAQPGVQINISTTARTERIRVPVAALTAVGTIDLRA